MQFFFGLFAQQLFSKNDMCTLSMVAGGEGANVIALLNSLSLKLQPA